MTITSFPTDIPSEMILNLVPLLFANVLQTGIAVIGLIDGIAETTPNFMKIYSGTFSDKRGKCKWLTVLGYRLSTIAKPIFYFAQTWCWVLGVRFTDWMERGIRTALWGALIAGSINERQHGLVCDLHRVGDTAGTFMGLLIAFFISGLIPAGNLLLPERTFHVLILTSIISTILAGIVLALEAKEISSIGQSGAPSLSLKYMSRNFKLFMLALILVTLGDSSDSFFSAGQFALGRHFQAEWFGPHRSFSL